MFKNGYNYFQGVSRACARGGLSALRRLARLIPALALRNCFAGAAIPNAKKKRGKK